MKWLDVIVTLIDSIFIFWRRGMGSCYDFVLRDWESLHCIYPGTYSYA